MVDRVSRPRACRLHIKKTSAAQENRQDATPKPNHNTELPVNDEAPPSSTRGRLIQRDRESTKRSSPPNRGQLTQTGVHTELSEAGESPDSREGLADCETAPPRGLQTRTGAGGDLPPSNEIQLPLTEANRFRIEHEAVEKAATAQTTLRLLERRRLTHHNLALFTKMANNGTSSGPPTAFSAARSSVRTISSGMSSSGRKILNNGMLDPGLSKPPSNLEDIRTQLAQPRGSPPPTQSEYNRFASSINREHNEETLRHHMIQMLFKSSDHEGYNLVLNKAFSSFPKDAGFNSGLSAPQPDYLEGLNFTEFRPFAVDEFLTAAVLHPDYSSTTLAHLAGEWKCAGRNMDSAQSQSAYDGAALVYARNQALSHLERHDPPVHAEVLTFTTDGQQLNLYAHYAVGTGHGRPEYHQFKINSILLGSPEGFREARKWLRNSQDYARERSYALRDQLLQHWTQRSGGPDPPIGKPIVENISGKIRGDGTGHDVVEQSRHPMPAASSLASSSPSISPASGSGSEPRGRKRKASSSEGCSEPPKKKIWSEGYWTWHEGSRNWFHIHPDGTVAWLVRREPDGRLTWII